MASDEQFSLCWNNFHANMSAGFHGLLSRGDLVDVTLAAEGRLLQAHKLVLSVCSPYFQEMFKMNPTQHPIVFLKDVSHSALRDLLQFMYQGEVNVKQEELASFISTAEQLQVKGLTGNQNEESSTPSKPKPTSRPGPRSSQQRQSVMTKLETDLDSKPSSTPVAVKRPNRPSIASNNSSSSQSGPAKRKCVDPLEAGPSGSAKDEFVTIPDEDENNAVAPKMEPEFVNESMWDDDEDGANNEETNFGEDDSNMEMTGFDGSTTGDGNITGGGEGGAVGDAQGNMDRKKRKCYTNAQVAEALSSIRQGLSIYQASKQYNVPETTLRSKRDELYENEHCGKQPVLNLNEERQIVDWVHYLDKCGFPVTKHQLLHTVSKLVENLQRPNPFKDGVPGKKWFSRFMLRHPTVSKCVLQNLPTNRNQVTDVALRSWFSRVGSYFKDNDLLPVLQDPKRIFNCDETGFFLCPKDKQVLVKKDSKRVYNRVANDEKECLTVLVNVSADGNVAPPMVLFPYERLPNNIKSTVPSGWGLGNTESGWMNMESFYEYVANVFYPWLRQQEITLPVALFLDGHTSHISLPLTTFCKEKGIVLVALLPSSTHVLQPLDVAVFRPVKETWRDIVREFREKHKEAKLKRTDFPREVEKCFDRSLKPETIISGFKCCGLYPFDEKNIDYDNLLSKVQKRNTSVLGEIDPAM
ncbi:uncharacterized protein LOC142976394 isoform X1 [Anticarsia gemmatalis]|uniref:uncharacterized protein LOC142976394 isoform X1 n=1 Tax=Anticarsia gemmatalis TaxID=129554 RepID=UPI003F76EC98